MKFLLGHEIPRPTNVYHLTIDFMHGDADGDSSTTLTFERGQEGDMAEVVAVINKVEELNSWEVEKYETIEGFARLLLDSWDRDCTCDGMYLASYNGHNIVYFDELGKEFQVIVEE